ncbi:hypothetical protein [Rhizobium rhizogenes]|uniref:hypothetical protein n=1 Tax=Rhizobium rhizogenes TaxID=359 RepID=UPI001573BA11|nr:hypothetical protein [Rhizobium rhizogenes]NTG07237.1 hypothetical protein [Rhizobium rhizogenes]
MSDIYIKIEMVGDDRRSAGSLMEQIRSLIQDFGYVESMSHSMVGAVQSLEASVTPTSQSDVWSSDRDAIGDYRMDN